MNLPINKDGNIELDLFEIVSIVIDKATPEERETITEYFGLQNPIREWMVERLANEYSRHCFYESVHQDRRELLKKIKEHELAYYADLIAEKVEREKRFEKAYYNLRNWCSENAKDYPWDRTEIDFDFRRNLEEMVINIIKQERQDLLEVNG